MKTIFGKVGAEKKIVTDQFNPKTTIRLKIGDMMDVAFDNINRCCKSKSRNRRS